MKAFAVTNKGIEDVALKEIKELVRVEAKAEDMVVLFSVNSFEDLCKIAYKAQSLSRVGQLLFKFKVAKELKSTKENLKKSIAKSSFSKWLKKENSFKVLCKRIGDHGFSGQDLAALCGELIIEKIKGYEQKTDMKNPDVMVYVFVNNNKGYLGIDFSGFDTGKRDYKIFSSATSLKPPVAYALLRLAGFKLGDTLLDPFCKDGVVVIEAAMLASKKPVNYYRKDKLQFTKYDLKIDFDKLFERLDKKNVKPKGTKIYCFTNQMRYLSAAKKNCKIGGVNKLISFGKVDVEWLDARLSKAEVDVVVASAPRISKNLSFFQKLYNELFYQAKYIVKKNGKVVLLSNNADVLKEAASKNDFKLIEERVVWQGKQDLVVCVFKKS